MSVKIDIEASEKARAEGNAAFKKGKWVESIGHYTTSTVYNPSNPIGYSNRAQAYLKLDKFQDAERDCTTALELDKVNLKALYRRGLARKGLAKVEEAIQDIQELLRLDPKNSVARSELEELKSLQAKKKKPQKPRLPPSPPSLSKREEASIEPIEDDEPALRHEEVEETKRNGVTPSFAALRKGRDGKKTFVSAPGRVPTILDKATPSQDLTDASLRPSSSTSTSTLQSSSKPTKPLPTPVAPTTPDDAPVSSTRRPPSPPDDPTSTSPGSGIRLIRKLNECINPSESFSLLSYYPPKTLVTILDGLIEPDILAQILVALYHGISDDSEGDDQEDGQAKKERVKEVMVGLRGTGRFGMNKAMLSRSERDIGENVWKACGGIDKW